MDLAAATIKQLAAGLGLDLCGIAPVERFAGAPRGFHPRDVLPECRSVVVIATQFSASTLAASSTVPYTIVRNHLTAQMDRLAVELAYEIEARGALAVPVGAIGPCNWDAERGKSMGLVSLKHAAVLAGLGKIGKNTLLVNQRYGNMIWLNAVITSAELEPDPLADYETCPAGCTLCLRACPVGALDGVSMDQQRCWDYAFGPENGGEWRIKCFTCRRVCPACRGLGVHSPSTADLVRA